jgi:hypothetical protein
VVWCGGGDWPSESDGHKLIAGNRKTISGGQMDEMMILGDKVSNRVQEDKSPHSVGVRVWEDTDSWMHEAWRFVDPPPPPPPPPNPTQTPEVPAKLVFGAGVGSADLELQPTLPITPLPPSFPAENLRELSDRIGRFPRCGVCNRKFKTRRDLLRHETIHTAEREFECPMCDRKFRYKSGLDGHMKRHTVGTPVRCDICGKKYRREEGVRKHKQAYHSGEYKYPCNICNRKFPSRSVLTQHRKSHVANSAGRHVCPRGCGRVFTNSDDYRKHCETDDVCQPPLVSMADAAVATVGTTTRVGTRIVQKDALAV